MTAPAPLPPRDIAALDVPLDELVARVRAQRMTDGALLEQRHQLVDLDRDSACTLPGCTCPDGQAAKGGARRG